MPDYNLLASLSNALPTLTEAYASVCKYVLDHRLEVPNMSTEELAQACGVSEATVVRFARKMGASGYRDFKISLSSANVLQTRDGIELADVHIGDTAGDVLDKLTSFTVSSIENTAAVIDRSELEHAIALIAEAQKNHGRVFVAAFGSSSTVARSFVIKMMRLGIYTVFFSDLHVQLEAIAGIRSDDLLICFSVLGRTAENEQLVSIARDAGCDVIVVTQQNNSRIAKQSTCLLLTACAENNLRLASQAALNVQILITDVIFTSLALKDLDSTRSAVEQTKQVFFEYGHYSPGTYRSATQAMEGVEY